MEPSCSFPKTVSKGDCHSHYSTKTVKPRDQGTRSDFYKHEYKNIQIPLQRPTTNITRLIKQDKFPVITQRNSQKQQHVYFQSEGKCHKFNLYTDREVGLHQYSNVLVNQIGENDDNKSTSDIVRMGIEKCQEELRDGIKLNIFLGQKKSGSECSSNNTDQYQFANSDNVSVSTAHRIIRK